MLNHLPEEALATGVSKCEWMTLWWAHCVWMGRGTEPWSRCVWNNNHVKREIICGHVIGEFYYPTQKYVCGTWVLAPSALTFSRSPCRLWTPTGLLTVSLELHWLLDRLMFIIHIGVGGSKVIPSSISADTMWHRVTVLWIFAVVLLQMHSPDSILIACFRASVTLHTLFWTLSSKLMSSAEEGE